MVVVAAWSPTRPARWLERVAGAIVRLGRLRLKGLHGAARGTAGRRGGAGRRAGRRDALPLSDATGA